MAGSYAERADLAHDLAGVNLRLYPLVDGREDQAIREGVAFARQLITFLPAGFRPAAHRRLDEIEARIWRADRDADGLCDEARRDLEDRDRHLARLTAATTSGPGHGKAGATPSAPALLPQRKALAPRESTREESHP